MWFRTHFGAGIHGRTSVTCRIISNEVLPEPITTPAWYAIVGTPERSRTSPTSLRLRRCFDSSPSGCSPPR